jgi:hypothetical protein
VKPIVFVFYLRTFLDERPHFLKGIESMNEKPTTRLNNYHATGSNAVAIGLRWAFRAGLVALFAYGFPQSGAAALYTWTAPGGGDWNTASNWSPANVPANNSPILINPNGGTVTGNPPGGDDKFQSFDFDNGRIEDQDRANANNSGTWNIGDGNVGNGTATFVFGPGNGTMGAGTFRGGNFNINADGQVNATTLNVGHGSSNAPTKVNINGGTVSASGSLLLNNYATTINLSGGALNITGDFYHKGATSSTLNISGGSLSADEYTVDGWNAGKTMAINIAGNNASQIQFRQFNLDDNSGGTGDLSYTLVTGQTVTPISLTDSTAVFNNHADIFSDNFTVNILSSGVDDSFHNDLVLFALTNAPDFNGLTQLRFDDLIGNSFRQAGDQISLGIFGGKIDYHLHFDALRTGNLGGNLEVWLENYVVPAPEPSSFLLLGLGMLLLRKRTRRRNG